MRAEVNSFECQKQGSNGGCADPYKYSLAFQNLSLSRIEALIEPKQVGYPLAGTPPSRPPKP